MTKGTKDPDKTNVMRILDSRKIHYNIYTYDPNPALTGAEIAGILKEPADRVFKTLVTQGRTNRFYVFIYELNIFSKNISNHTLFIIFNY